MRAYAYVWARGQDDAVQHEPPDRAVHLDDAAVGQEFLEVAPHRPVAGGFRRAEIDDEHTDPAMADGGMAGRLALLPVLRLHQIAPVQKG